MRKRAQKKEKTDPKNEETDQQTEILIFFRKPETDPKIEETDPKNEETD